MIVENISVTNVSAFEDLKKLPEKAPFLPKTIVDNIQKRMNIVSLTPLQKDTFNSPCFWSEENIIIKGTTSSGKTLVAEVAAANCIHHSGQTKNVIYLVPLKAMVTEKYNQFRHDMSDNNYDWNICPSSADYQNFDEDILGGHFNIAIVVYEKFFAFLAQKKNENFLKNCGLVIVDEIQMVSEMERGAKLEFSIAKLLKDHKNIRIMGLTTVHCNTNKLESWLNAKLISNSQRSCDLYEHIIMTNGSYKVMFRSRDDQSSSTENEGILENYNNQQKKPYDRKVDLLLSLLKNELRNGTPENPVKVIVFAHSKRTTEKLAEAISSVGILPERTIGQTLRNDLGRQDDDEVIAKMMHLIQRGVAYHNASLPQGTRAIIEEQFKSGSIHVIVATATLAIGLNLPADVIILFDHTVKEDGISHDIEGHVYKNYIGRAGRLGLSTREGKSFLLAETQGERNGCWDRYVNATAKEINSALNNFSELDIAPYYLNYIAGNAKRSIMAKDLMEFSAFTFGHNYQANGETKPIESILLDLKKWKLISVSTDTLAEIAFTENKPNLRADDLPMEDRPYEITAYGHSLAQYALPLRTCASIIMYFIQPYQISNEGLPRGYSYFDLQTEKFLLDIFYRVCLMDNVQRLSFLQMPSQDNQIYSKIKNAIINYIKEIDARNGLWENSRLKEFLSGPKDSQYETAALRAILLIHWFRGEEPRVMREKTKISIPFTIGDLDHLGEVCSYLIESISQCIPQKTEIADGDNNRLMSAFHILSNRTKYGLPLNLVRLKNRHVFGITRRSLIEMSQCQEIKHYESPAEFVKYAPKSQWGRYISVMQREELLRTLDLPMKYGDISSLANKLSNDGLVDVAMKEALNKIDRESTYALEWSEWVENVIDVLYKMGMNVVNTSYSGEYIYVDKNKTLCIYFPQIEGTEVCQSENVFGAKDAVNNSNYSKVLIVCKNGFTANVLELYSEQERSKILCVHGEVLSGLICQSIFYENKQSLHVLTSAIFDLVGEINVSDSHRLQRTVSNYSRVETTVEQESEIALYAISDGYTDADMHEFLKVCRDEDIPCATISWSEDNMGYLTNIINSGKPMFIYFCDEVSAQSQFVRNQIDSIINRDLMNDQDRSMFILWKTDDVKNIFEKKYPYFHSRGEIKGTRNMSDIVMQLKNSIENSHPIQTITKGAKRKMEHCTNNDSGNARRFKVALSFSGEHRIFVSKIADDLAKNYTKNFVLYDEYHRAEFARPNLDTHLQTLYRDESDLIVVFICSKYNKKEWTGIEWRAIRDLMNHKENDERIMFVKCDEGTVDGVFGTIDGYIDAKKVSNNDIVSDIMGRYNSLG